MISISSAVYELLLERTEEFQQNLIPKIYGSSSASSYSGVEGDDVYFRFGGAAFCDMLHRLYDHIEVARGILIHKR